MSNMERILDRRCGSVLDSRSILKVDHIPGDMRMAAPVGDAGPAPEPGRSHGLFSGKIRGVRNFRRAAATGTHGAAQPTVAGIRGVLNALGAGRRPHAQPRGRTAAVATAACATARGPSWLVRPGGGGGGGGADEGDDQDRDLPLPSVLWINLREEPTLYINGRSVALRDRFGPFRNIDHLEGMHPRRIQDLESRLKDDVLDESDRYGGSVVLHEETRARRLEAGWEAVSRDDVWTPDEVFFDLASRKRYRVIYVRIPTTPERPPSPRFFDGLVHALMNHVSSASASTPSDSYSDSSFRAGYASAPGGGGRRLHGGTAVVFNCQNGVSRSTLGMVASGLVQMWRGLIYAPSPAPAPAARPSRRRQVAATNANAKASAKTLTLAGDLPETPSRKSKNRVGDHHDNSDINENNDDDDNDDNDDNDDDGSASSSSSSSFFDKNDDDDALSRRLRSGFYRPTLALIRLLDTGSSSKRRVDYLADDSSHIVDLRLQVYAQYMRSERERHGPTGLLKLKRAATALMRYLLLMTFDAYLADQVGSLRRGAGAGAVVGTIEKEGGGGGYPSSRSELPYGGGGSFPEMYRQWLDARPEIVNLLESIERDPASAMSGGLAATLHRHRPRPGPGPTLHPAPSEILRSRRGSVLASDTILKADRFPHSAAAAVSAATAAATSDGTAIRGAPNFRKVEGTRVYGSCTPTRDAAVDIVRYIQSGRNRRVVWTNLREEPVIYLCGEPFVLRSASNPFRNTTDFVDVDPDRLEAAERRLKADVLDEARRCGGKVLIHSEAERWSLQSVWVDVSSAAVADAEGKRETVEADDSVQTPREVFDSLRDSGMDVDYERVPQTPERPPDPKDVERLLDRVRRNATRKGTHFVFNCQMGRGRSTSAMAMAVLELQRMDAAAAAAEDEASGVGLAAGAGAGGAGGGSGVVSSSSSASVPTSASRPAEIRGPGMPASLDFLHNLLASSEGGIGGEGGLGFGRGAGTVRGSGIDGVSGYFSPEDGEDDDGDEAEDDQAAVDVDVDVDVAVGTEEGEIGREEVGRAGTARTTAARSGSVLDILGHGDGSTNGVESCPSVSVTEQMPTRDPSTKRGAAPGQDEFGILLSLVRVLRHGVMAKSWADLVAAKCGEVENVRRNIVDCIARADLARTSERSEEHVERALLNLRRFFVLVLVAAYEIEYDPRALESFVHWYDRHREIRTIYREIQGREALMYASVDRVLSGPPPSEANELAAAGGVGDDGRAAPTPEAASVARFVARRNGAVLTRGSIVKSDHFPGCDRLRDATVGIGGAPNLREIRASVEAESDIGIFGTGIPTVDGLRGTLEYVSNRHHGGSGRRVIWINLREEPILYVNGKPFVLRKLEHPFENLEHTGISRERVESMEDRLKVDVINEVLETGGRLLVHDEDESGIKPTWLSVDVSEGSTSVQTPRDLYRMLGREYDVTQYRVPITDEQAPKVSDYDEISSIVRTAPLDAEVVFNCQMGRGRTTTGLVMATAVRLWEHYNLRSFATRLEQLVQLGVVKTRRKVGAPGLDPDARRYLGGGYVAVTALTRVLDNGIAAKATIDAVIDACDSMQNLREATYNMKVASVSEDRSRVQRVAALNRGVHYLRRYCQLVAFAAYLFEYSPEDRTRIRTFAAWLGERRELISIMKRATLD